MQFRAWAKACALANLLVKTRQGKFRPADKVGIREHFGATMARASDSNILVAIIRDKTFQAREIRRVIKLSLAYLLITTALLGLFYNHMLGELTSGASPLLFASEDMGLVNEAVPPLGTVLLRWLVAMMVINVVLTLSLGVYITRKLGHPLMAIRRALREVAAGNLDVRLRESDNDEFSELSTELQNALQVVRNQVAEAKSSIAEGEDGDAQATLKNVQNALSYFQVDGNEASSNDSSHAA